MVDEYELSLFNSSDPNSSSISSDWTSTTLTLSPLPELLLLFQSIDLSSHSNSNSNSFNSQLQFSSTKSLLLWFKFNLTKSFTISSWVVIVVGNEVAGEEGNEGTEGVVVDNNKFGNLTNLFKDWVKPDDLFESVFVEGVEIVEIVLIEGKVLFELEIKLFGKRSKSLEFKFSAIGGEIKGSVVVEIEIDLRCFIGYKFEVVELLDLGNEGFEFE